MICRPQRLPDITSEVVAASTGKPRDVWIRASNCRVVQSWTQQRMEQGVSNNQARRLRLKARPWPNKSLTGRAELAWSCYIVHSCCNCTGQFVMSQCLLEPGMVLQ